MGIIITCPLEVNNPTRDLCYDQRCGDTCDPHVLTETCPLIILCLHVLKDYSQVVKTRMQSSQSAQFLALSKTPYSLFNSPLTASSSIWRSSYLFTNSKTLQCLDATFRNEGTMTCIVGDSGWVDSPISLLSLCSFVSLSSIYCISLVYVSRTICLFLSICLLVCFCLFVSLCLSLCLCLYLHFVYSLSNAVQIALCVVLLSLCQLLTHINIRLSPLLLSL